MRISVVVATYNGAEYILQQLDSIRCQTFLPDEVIIRDDCSTDATAEIINNYIGQFQLNNWQLIRGKENLGWKKNFYTALTLCTGDYIFLSDQDDIWKNNKIETVIKKMEECPNISLLAHGYHSFYEGKAKAHHDRGGKGDTLKKIPFSKRILSVRYPGCTYCIRRPLLEIFKRTWFDGVPHDAMLWYLAMMTDSLYASSAVLMDYRRHPQRVMNKNKVGINEEREIILRHIASLRVLLNLQLASKQPSLEKIKILKNLLSWYGYRRKLLVDGKLSAVFPLVFKLPWYKSLGQFGRDIRMAFLS